MRIELIMRASTLLILSGWVILAGDPGGEVFAQGPVTRAFVGGKIVTVSGPEIADGVMVVRGKQILAVGVNGEMEIPAGAEKVDVAGKTLMPGLICTHSHLGGTAGGDGSDPIQPGVRVADSINVRDSGFKRALAGGLTSLNLMPGSGHLISGQTVYVKLRYGGDGPERIEDIEYRDDDGKAIGGLKMANGTNSIGSAPFPGTRGKSAYLVRQQFIKAREYHNKKQLANGDPEKMPPRDLGLEALVEAMQGKRIVHHHTHRHDDINTVIRLAQELGLSVVLHHVSDGWKVADEIAAAGMACSITLVDSPGGKLEALDNRWLTAGVLEKADVLTAFHTDDWITDSRYFFRMAAFGVRGGMSREKALEGLTIAGAKMMGLDQRIGSLDTGKDADFIVLDGDPLSIYTKVLETWVEGEKVFDRSDPQDRLYAVGGFGASHDQRPYYCCFGNQRRGE